MDLKKLLELLGVDSLDETKQEEIKDSLKTIIDTRAKEEADTLLKSEKEALVESMEGRFEEYKKEITSKFSNFVDSVLEEELVIPEKVLEYARKGELYNELIEQFKVRLAIDEGLLDEEVKDLLREAKKEIIGLREQVDGLMEAKLEQELRAQQLDAEMHLRQKADGLTEAKKLKVFELLEGVTDKDEIDKKYNLIVESLTLTEEDDKDSKDIECICPDCGAKKTLSETTDCPACPECETEMGVKTDEGVIDVDKDEDEEDDKIITEDDKSPFSEFLEGYTRTLKENTYR
jgi:hypothetical protein